MEHLLGHTVAPFQEVIHAWTAQGSLYNPSLLHVDRVLVGTVSVPIPRLTQERAVPKEAPKHHSWDEDSASLGPINLTPQPGYCLKEPGFHLQAAFVPSWGPRPGGLEPGAGDGASLFLAACGTRALSAWLCPHPGLHARWWKSLAFAAGRAKCLLRTAHV